MHQSNMANLFVKRCPCMESKIHKEEIMKEQVPLSPEELPPKGNIIAMSLPKRSNNFRSEVYESAIHEQIVPKRKPARATYLVQLEWAWSCLQGAVLSFHTSMNRSRSHWILWSGYFDDNETPWRWEYQPVLVAKKIAVPREHADLFLLADALSILKETEDYERYHWVNEIGSIPVWQVEAVADMVWGKKK